MSDNAKNNVKLSYNATCSNKRPNGCNDVHVGEVVNFTATIRPIKCQNLSHEVIRIKPDGVDETLTVELEISCGCPCENKSHPTYEKNSPICKGAGDLQCGICSCHGGRYE